MSFLDEFAAALYERRHQAISVTFHSLVAPGWKPMPGDCHANVNRLCDLALGYQPVRGWLIYDLTLLRRVRFIAHSVVRDLSGDLIDITPGRLPGPKQFLVHEDQDEFYMIVTGHDLTCPASGPLIQI
jgi:hypothetical protein